MSLPKQVSLKRIQSAKTKPEGVSDARWRMELSRRRKGYHGYPESTVVNQPRFRRFDDEG